jgi:hypothetical protein
MSSLSHDRFCDEVIAQTGLLRDVVAGADLSVTVPTTPDWTLAQLLRHVGGNLRALELAVRSGEAVTEPERQVPDLAADAIDEFLDLLGNLAGDQGAGPAGTVHLHATDAGPDLDAEWLVELGPSGFTWRRGHEKATVAVRAPLADLLRVVTRRLPPDAAGVEVLGDRQLLAAWLERLRLQ